MINQIDDFTSLKTLIEKEQRIKTIIKRSTDNITIVPIKDLTIDDNFYK